MGEPDRGSCTYEEDCPASIHWAACPAGQGRNNDDAMYNRSNMTVEDAMNLGFWDMVPTSRGDSMG